MADLNDADGTNSRFDDPDWIKGLVAKALIRSADEPIAASPPPAPIAASPPPAPSPSPPPPTHDVTMSAEPTPKAVVGNPAPPPDTFDPFAGLEAPSEPAPIFDVRTGLPQQDQQNSAGERSALTARIGSIAKPPMPDLERALEVDRISAERSSSTPDVGQVVADDSHRVDVPYPGSVQTDIIKPEVEIMVEEEVTSEGFRTSDIRTVLEWLAVIVSALVVALVIKAFVLQAFWIPSESMQTTVNKGDRILVNKVSYRLHDVRRGDLVVFKKLPGTPGDTEDLIKRAIALPGETIEVRADGRIWIWEAGETPEDALLLEEPYLDSQNALISAPSATDSLSSDIWDERCVNQPRTPGRCTLADDQYFMMGDNRHASSDSRFFGPITDDLIVGRAFLRIWPLGEISSL